MRLDYFRENLNFSKAASTASRLSLYIARASLRSPNVRLHGTKLSLDYFWGRSMLIRQGSSLSLHGSKSSLHDEPPWLHGEPQVAKGRSAGLYLEGATPQSFQLPMRV
jgi:hypothetical protein